MAYQPKSYRKFLAGTVSAAVVASAIAPVASASFTDVAGSVHADDIATLVAKGYIKGYPDGTFKPNNSLTRGEAAIIFSRILKDAGVTQKGAGFPDVPASRAELAEAVAIVQGAGIMTGDDKGNFNPNANITREQMAKVVVEAFKLTKPANYTTKVTDLDKAAPWAREYIQVLEANGVTKNTEFMPKRNVTRAQFASFVVRAMNVEKEVSAADITAVKLVDEKTLEVTFNGELKEVKKEDFAIQGVEIESVSIKEEAAAEAKTTVVVIKTKTALEEGKTYSVSYKGQTTDKAKVDVPVVTPKVESVSAINAKQIKVTFNKAVDKNTVFSNVSTGALNAGVVTVKRTVNDTTDTNKNVDSSVDTITGSLSADGKTLTLTVDVTGAKYFDGTYAVTVSDAVKTTDGKTLTAYAGTFTAKDQTAPTVKEVVYNTITNEVEVTFAEPVTRVPDVVRLNGEPVSGVVFVSNTNQTKVKFTKPSSVAAGSTASIYVAGTTDAASNILSPYNGNVTFTNDASALQVTSVTQISSNKVKVVFNKSLASNDATIDGALTAIIDGRVVAAGDVTAALDTTDTSNKTVIVTFSGSYTAPNYFYGSSATSKAVTLTFANGVITDVFGKKLAATTQSITMTKDATGPQVVSAKIASNGVDIEVTFDEEIANTGDTAKIVLRKDGVAMNTAASAVRKGATGDDAKVLVITPNAADLVSGKLPAGTYTVRLEAGAIADAHTNNNAVATTTVSKAATTTDLTATIATQAGQRNIFEVTFSEDVTTSSALNLANYKLDGAALPSGTDIYFKNGAANRTVVIELPQGSINFGAVGTGANAVLAVSGVQTSSGKTVIPTSGTVLVEDNTPATLQSATLVGSNVLKLTFNENISASFADVADILDDIQISNGTTTFTAGDATHTASVSGKDLVITINPGTSNWSAVTSSPTVTVKTLTGGDGDIKDVNGVTVKGDVSVTLTK
ncbi:S-layer homology domain-containing protein [Anoxybacillus pushchinoensis]|uniref:S-layer homology domain-containing protein n=1 Tax=Anoxybacillus pushchinoensis TaxID=150248 RepID=A0A1I0U4T6_9BACL|nr:S-layer homology domain-containing protein [Anoxybacillus pushchinoensis]SFA59082.1 S-layer homology domain-containing protein [Anoxybacillus pushchinoensis]